jgi:hypothetical protein
MTGRASHSYWVKATDWHNIAGRGRLVLVRPPFDRHRTDDVVLIYTQGVGEAAHLEAAEHWKVIGIEGTVNGSMTGLAVRRAKLAEVFPPGPDPTTMTVLERIKEAERHAYAILSDLAGCVGMERKGVNELRDKVRRLTATIVGIEFEPDCEHRWDWPDGTTRHGRPSEA